jgi:hypothetical protein
VEGTTREESQVKTLFTEEERQALRESVEANKAGAKRAEAYVKRLVDEMLRLRGYSDPRKAHPDAFNDVHRVLVKADRIWTRMFETNMKPERAAELIQNMVWDGKFK